ncbi:MAG: AraC family transcriptional regulator [Luteolibacter sp.]
MELTWFRSGSGTRFVGDHLGPFEAGDLVLMGSHLPHYWHTRDDSSGLSIQWHFPAGHPFWLFPEHRELMGLFKRASRGLSFSGAAAREAARQMQELTTTRSAAKLGAFIRLLSDLHAAPENERAALSGQSFSLPGNSSQQGAISSAVSHLIHHFREEVRIEDLLRLTHMGRTTFARQFKRHSGHTFSEFLNHLRLQAACRELEQGDRSILDISIDCGFTQISFFNRLFRRQMGCSPRDFRKNSRQTLLSNSGRSTKPDR